MNKTSNRFWKRILKMICFAVLILATVVSALLIGRVLLGLALLGSLPAPENASDYRTVLVLLVVGGLMAWLLATFFSSWKRVGQVTGIAAALLALAEVLWAVAAPDQALYIARTYDWGESKVSTYQKQFPSHPLTAAPVPYRFAASPDPRVAEVFAQVSGAADWNTFLEKNDTQAFIVLHDGKVVYENYFNGTARDTLLTSFSMSKSFTSALIGEAIQDGSIHSVDDPITQYLPELAQRDARFSAITLRNLLMMDSGLDYQAKRPPAFLGVFGDDPLTTYYPDQRSLALQNTHIIAPPGLYWLYNKYHPQLLGMILERTTGMSVTQYLQKKIWTPLGMEYAGSWSIDSQTSSFEKMEAGVNARAIDYAKFGQLFLNGGGWQGSQVISKAWVDESTRPSLSGYDTVVYPGWFTTSYGNIYYAFMWWGVSHPDGSHDFLAWGDHGQFIYVSPQKHLVIVRNGLEFGIPGTQWVELFNEFASQY